MGDLVLAERRYALPAGVPLPLTQWESVEEMAIVVKLGNTQPRIVSIAWLRDDGTGEILRWILEEQLTLVSGL